MAVRTSKGLSIKAPGTTGARTVTEQGFRPLEPWALRMVIAGRVGTGKTVFAASWPDAMIWGPERKDQYVPRVASGSQFFYPTNWEECKRIVDELVQAGPGSQTFGFRTIIFDIFESMIDLIISDLSRSFDDAQALGNLPIEDITKNFGKSGAGWDVVYREWTVHFLNKLVRAGYGLIFTTHLQPVYLDQGGVTTVGWRNVAPPKALATALRMCDFSGFTQRTVSVVDLGPDQNSGKVLPGRKILRYKTAEQIKYHLCLLPPDVRLESREPIPMLNREIELPLGYGYDAFVAEYTRSCEAYRQVIENLMKKHGNGGES